ncbi:MAG TPA: DUF6502 family protein [Albitalea sp.]|nr:DUF6502 family protein [Albitalea sp.]
MRPSEQHAELALREAVVLMAPVARWLLRHGVSYPAFAALLKSVFVDVAREELERSGARPTHSALSVLSGVHRKDVRTLESQGSTVRAEHSIPLASQVFTRWLSEVKYRDADGKPRPLSRSGSGKHSFEKLARETSNDVHPRAMLDELVRSGLVHVDGDIVTPLESSFVPSRKLDELTALFSANASDHIAAAVHNLTVKAPKFLEQSVFANGLTQASADHLHQCARDAWNAAFASIVSEARERVEADADADADIRVRFGAYFYSEPAATASPPPPAAEARATAPRKTRTRRSST